MPVTYEKADAEVEQLIADVMGQYHSDLVAVDLNVCCLMAIAPKDEHGEPLVPALKLHGVKCAGIARIVSYKDRVAGGADVQILLDGDDWKTASDPHRLALVDHELNHFELQLDDEGNVKSDDHGRPKVKMRPHDIDAGWFHSIARRHGDASYEVRQAKAFADEFGQLYFGWASPPASHPDAGPTPAASVDSLKKSVTITTDAARKAAKALRGSKSAPTPTPVQSSDPAATEREIDALLTIAGCACNSANRAAIIKHITGWADPLAALLTASPAAIALLVNDVKLMSAHAVENVLRGAAA